MMEGNITLMEKLENANKTLLAALLKAREYGKGSGVNSCADIYRILSTSRRFIAAVEVATRRDLFAYALNPPLPIAALWLDRKGKPAFSGADYVSFKLDPETREAVFDARSGRAPDAWVTVEVAPGGENVLFGLNGAGGVSELKFEELERLDPKKVMASTVLALKLVTDGAVLSKASMSEYGRLLERIGGIVE
jgi:hypothetical protein